MNSFGIISSASDVDAAHLSALVGVVFTNACHYLSTLVLYHLSLAVWADSTWALVSALLHVLSPAGLFLSAPYAESPCSLLSFTGWLLLVSSCSRGGSRPLSRDALTLLSGVSFGMATYFRTNALLNGAPFAFEALLTLYRLVEDLDPGSTATHVRRLVVLGIAGLCVAAGTVGPQFIAYRTYCTASVGSQDDAGLGVRPWCGSFVPSIYNFVQREYW